VVIGSQTAAGPVTLVTTAGALDLADGAHAITARQTESGKQRSAASGALTVTVDTRGPVAGTPQFDFATGQALRFPFGEDVGASLGVADLTLENLTQATTVAAALIDVAFANDTGTFTFARLPGRALPDGNYRATVAAAGVTDAAGNPLGGPVVLDFFVLAGDADRDRTVNFNDLLALARNYNKTGKAWADGDFTGDGVVNFNDLLILAKAYNKTMPAPALVPGAAPVAGASESVVSAVLDGGDGERDGASVFSTTRVARPAPATKPKAAPRPLRR
jgi:hypothetical protein